jgi:chemotaxis protein CheX
MLRHILLALGENGSSEGLYNERVGEIANAISGNARRQPGKEFNISVPEVVRKR